MKDLADRPLDRTDGVLRAELGSALPLHFSSDYVFGHQRIGLSGGLEDADFVDVLHVQGAQVVTLSLGLSSILPRSPFLAVRRRYREQSL